MLNHIIPPYTESNGVAGYGKVVDEIIASLPQSLITKNIVHVELGNGGYQELWQAYRLRKRPPGQKLVLTLHDPPVVCAKPFERFIRSTSLAGKILRKALDLTIGALVLRKVIQSADQIIVLNPKAVVPTAQKFHISPSRITISALCNLVPIFDRKGVQKRTSRPILFFGNLAQQKGVDVLLRAYIGSKLDNPVSPLVIAGKWGDNQRYRKKVEALATCSKNVTFAGRVSNESLDNLLHAAAMVVLPYSDPGIIHASGPLVASMVRGQTIIASDIPIFSGYVTSGITAELFPPGNSAALLEKLVTVHAQPKYAAELGANAQKLASATSSLETIKQTLYGVYSSL